MAIHASPQAGKRKLGHANGTELFLYSRTRDRPIGHLFLKSYHTTTKIPPLVGPRAHPALLAALLAPVTGGSASGNSLPVALGHTSSSLLHFAIEYAGCHTMEQCNAAAAGKLRAEPRYGCSGCGLNMGRMSSGDQLACLAAVRRHIAHGGQPLSTALSSLMSQ